MSTAREIFEPSDDICEMHRVPVDGTDVNVFRVLLDHSVDRLEKLTRHAPKHVYGGPFVRVFEMSSGTYFEVRRKRIS